MELNDNMKLVIAHALKEKKVTQVELAKHVGLTQVWVSKMLRPLNKDGLQSLTDTQVCKIEERLSIELYVLIDNRRKVSGTAMRLSELGDSMPEMNRVMESLAALGETKSVVFQPSHFDTVEMLDLGKDISDVVVQNLDRPRKIARDVIRLVCSNRCEPKKN
jgi:DNA-binding Lrp family transcriptional regulator